jgi:hypothetical protein
MAIPGAFGTFMNGFHLLLARGCTTDDDARSFRPRRRRLCRLATGRDGVNARIVPDDDISRRRSVAH